MNLGLARLGHRALLRLEPEMAHDLGVALVARGMVPLVPVPERPVEALGQRFRNPVGLAAGFDKNGVGLAHWHKFGFGFVEIGTVTRHAQPGNPRPRLFRFPEHGSLVNRLGFNNEGADAVARRLERRESPIPVGVNIGKSRATELDDAAEDYEYSFRLLAPLADYVVVNVSSPNTPGLRALQEKESLHRIVSTIRMVDSSKPLLVKVAPDLAVDDLDDVVEVCVECGLQGIVATNTTVSRPFAGTWPEGGLSGALLREKADAALAHLGRVTPDGFALIGVGGIATPADLERKLALGATLVQAYTGFVYAGPEFVGKLLPP